MSEGRTLQLQTLSEVHLDFAAEAGRIGLWELDLATGCLVTSARYKANLGLPPDAPLTWDGVEALVHPDDRERRAATLRQAIAIAEEYDIEYRVLRPDGHTGWLHVSARVARDPDGRPQLLAGVSFDVTERRQAEWRLELSEESLRLAADAAEIGIWDLDLANDALTWSDRTNAMFGISPGVPVTMRDFYGGLHPDDFEATAAAFASAIDPAVRATYDVEYRTVGREDGVIRWVAAKGRGLFNAGPLNEGRCHRAIGTAIDITARKLAALRQDFLLNLMDSLRHLTDPDAIMATAVQALGRHLGACRVGYGQVQPDDVSIHLETCFVDGVQRLTGLFALDSFGPLSIARQRRGYTVAVDDVAGDPQYDLAVWDGIGTRAFVSVPLVRDGRLRASLFVNHRNPHVWHQQETALIEDVARRLWDVLERARAEEALRQLNAALEQQVEQRTQELRRTWRLAPVVMVVAGPDGKILDVNPAWTGLLGWTPDETIGRNVMEFVAPEDQAAGSAGMQRLARGLPVIEFQLRFVSKSGAHGRISWTTVPDGGQLYGYGRDVTDQVKAEERLLQAQKMEAVGQLTGGLAHDFNNLLTGVTAGLELLQKRIKQGRLADLDRYIGAAQGAARRAASLTQRLLAFSRRQTLDPRPTDVSALVAGMEEFIQRSVGPHLRLRLSCAADLWTVLVDGHQLENALLNLCINARDAMPDGGDLTIAAANVTLGKAAARDIEVPPGDYVELCVTDTGAGMAPDVMRRAFDPFFTTKPLGAGTGLGLSMVYGFAQQSGGQVRIQSAPGQGTSVRLYLPRDFSLSALGDLDAPAEHGLPGAAAPAARPATVLVVDDEASIRMLVCEALHDLGYSSVQAEDGAAALKILESGTALDLLVSDVGLPGGLNGRQLADHARRTREQLKVLFITGYAESASVGPAQLEAGMQVMCKPFELDTLAARIRDMIAE
jgi:PAS domain S-box-containing protein